MGKRGYGEGSIYHDVKRGLWVVSISQGRGATGRRSRRRIYAGSEAEARRLLRDGMRKQHRGELPSSGLPTLGAFLKAWLEDVVRPTVRPATFRSYRLFVDKLRPLDTLKLDELSPAHLQRLLNAKRESGLSARSVHHMRAVLRTALNEARRRRLITVNVAELVRLPTPPRPDLRILSAAQAADFLESTRGDRRHALYVLALNLGMRQGELLGLRWDDVDLVARLITVRHALQRIDGRLQLVEPKSRQSRRVIPLSDPVTVALREHQARQAAEQLVAGPRWQEGGYVFATPVGAPLDAGTVSGAFHRDLAAAGLSGLRFHDLRHTCVSLLLGRGYDPRTVSDIIGHSQVRLTLDVYANTPAARQREALEGMGRLLTLPRSLATSMATSDAGGQS